MNSPFKPSAAKKTFSFSRLDDFKFMLEGLKLLLQGKFAIYR